jgi:hypothetical protein
VLGLSFDRVRIGRSSRLRTIQWTILKPRMGEIPSLDQLTRAIVLVPNAALALSVETDLLNTFVSRDKVRARVVFPVFPGDACDRAAATARPYLLEAVVRRDAERPFKAWHDLPQRAATGRATFQSGHRPPSW